MQTPTMESLASPHGQKQILHIRAKKSVFGGNQKDLWVVVREGSLVDVELALALVKKSGGHVNLKDIFGLTPLHIAVWRNHIPIVKRLIAAGADPNLRIFQRGNTWQLEGQNLEMLPHLNYCELLEKEH